MHHDGFPWTAVASLVIAGVAAASGFVALLVTLEFRRRDQQASLLARFDAKEFHVRIWRMERLTRQGSATAIVPMTLDEVERRIGGNRDKLAIFNDALARNWASNRVDMQSVYFFALEMRNTLPRWAWLGRRAASRRNRAFGYQLLSTFLDQQLVAWRLLPNERHVGMDDDQRPTYYADNYGLTDPRYVELVDWLANDLLEKHGSDLPAGACQRLRDKRAAIAAASTSRRQL